MHMTYWRNFKSGKWQEEINVRDFIVNNYTEYTGDDSFLEGPTAEKEDVSQIQKLLQQSLLMQQGTLTNQKKKSLVFKQMHHS